MDVFTQFARHNKKGKARLWKRIQEECATYPHELVKVPIDFHISPGSKVPSEVWRSRGYVVQIYDLGNGWERMSVNRNAFNSDFTRFLDGISWERLMELKEQCGRGGQEGLEIYPMDPDIVNVANLRHLWLKKSGSFIEEFGIGWKSNSEAAQSANSGTINPIQALNPTAPTDANEKLEPTSPQLAASVG